MATLFEVRLTQVIVDHNGYWEPGPNVLAFTLIYPRQGVPAMATTRVATLADATPVAFPRRSPDAAPYEDLLFRESVQGSAPLIVEVSATHHASWLTTLLAKAVGSVVGSAVGAIPVVGGALTAVVSSVGTLFDQFAPKDDNAVIGRGDLTLKEGMPNNDYTITLTVPKDVTLWKLAPPVHNIGSPPPQNQALRLAAGTINGSVRLNITSTPA